MVSFKFYDMSEGLAKGLKRRVKARMSFDHHLFIWRAKKKIPKEKSQEREEVAKNTTKRRARAMMMMIFWLMIDDSCDGRSGACFGRALLRRFEWLWRALMMQQCLKG